MKTLKDLLFKFLQTDLFISLVRGLMQGLVFLVILAIGLWLIVHFHVTNVAAEGFILAALAVLEKVLRDWSGSPLPDYINDFK